MGRTHGGTVFGEFVRSFVAFDAFVRWAICKGDGGVLGGRKVFVEKDVDAYRRKLAGMCVEIEEAGKDGFIVYKEDGIGDVMDDRPLNGFFERCYFGVVGRACRAPTGEVMPGVVVKRGKGVGSVG